MLGGRGGAVGLAALGVPRCVPARALSAGRPGCSALWGCAGVAEKGCPGGLLGPGAGQVQRDASSGRRDPRGDSDQFPTDRRGRRRLERRPGDGGGSVGEVERDDRENKPGRVCGEPARGQVPEGRTLQVRVGLLDDRMPTVHLIRGDRVESAGGEEGMGPVRVKEGRLGDFGLVEFRDAPDDEATVNVILPGPGGEHGEGHLGDLRVGNPGAGGGVEDGVRVLDLLSPGLCRWRVSRRGLAGQ